MKKPPRPETLKRYNLEAAQLGMEYVRPGAKPLTGHFRLPCGHSQDVYHQVVRDMRRIRCATCPAHAAPKSVTVATADPIPPGAEGHTRHKIAQAVAATHGLTYIKESEHRSYAFFSRNACGCTFRHHTNEARLTTAGRRCPVCKDKSLSKEEYEASKAGPAPSHPPTPTRAELNNKLTALAQAMQTAVEAIYAEIDALKGVIK
jgi:hypothetical protein